MTVQIPATQIQRKFGDFVRRVYSNQEHFMVEKDGLPVMAVLSIPEYNELILDRKRRQEERQERLRKFEQASKNIGLNMKKGLDEQEVLEQVEETRQSLHDEGYGN